MPLRTEIKSFNLKIIFLVHLVFAALASMGFWTTSAYLFYNAIFMLLLIWSIYNNENPEPVQLAIVVNGLSIILDILLLTMGFPVGSSIQERFSAAMCIFHLVIRPFSIILLIKNLQERSGVPGSLSGLFSPPNQQTPTNYEDIDNNTRSDMPPNYGFNPV